MHKTRPKRNKSQGKKVSVSHIVTSNSLWPHDCSPPGSSAHGINAPGKNTGVGCHSLLQGIFPTQRSNLGLPHCRQIFYHLSHQGNPSHKGTEAKSIHLPVYWECCKQVWEGLQHYHTVEGERAQKTLYDLLHVSVLSDLHVLAIIGGWSHHPQCALLLLTLVTVSVSYCCCNSLPKLNNTNSLSLSSEVQNS